jgi:hypothetical protein
MLNFESPALRGKKTRVLFIIIKQRALRLLPGVAASWPTMLGIRNVAVRTCEYVLPNTAAGGETSDKFLTSIGCHEIASEHFVSSGSSFIMDALGDCPQFVSMVNSAVQNLLTAKIISNEGHAALFQTIMSHSL